MSWSKVTEMHITSFPRIWDLIASEIYLSTIITMQYSTLGNFQGRNFFANLAVTLLHVKIQTLDTIAVVAMLQTCKFSHSEVFYYTYWFMGAYSS